jgi:hypothetical protein
MHPEKTKRISMHVVGEVYWFREYMGRLPVGHVDAVPVLG